MSLTQNALRLERDEFDINLIMINVLSKSTSLNLGLIIKELGSWHHQKKPSILNRDH